MRFGAHFVLLLFAVPLLTAVQPIEVAAVHQACSIWWRLLTPIEMACSNSKRCAMRHVKFFARQIAATTAF